MDLGQKRSRNLNVIGQLVRVSKFPYRACGEDTAHLHSLFSSNHELASIILSHPDYAGVGLSQLKTNLGNYFIGCDPFFKRPFTHPKHSIPSDRDYRDYIAWAVAKKFLERAPELAQEIVFFISRLGPGYRQLRGQKAQEVVNNITSQWQQIGNLLTSMNPRLASAYIGCRELLTQSPEGKEITTRIDHVLSTDDDAGLHETVQSMPQSISPGFVKTYIGYRSSLTQRANAEESAAGQKLASIIDRMIEINDQAGIAEIQRRDIAGVRRAPALLSLFYEDD